MTTTTGD